MEYSFRLWVTMRLVFLVSFLATVNSRPQEFQNGASIEIEKQNVTEIRKPQTTSTEEILEKIKEVNRQQGLSSNGLKANLGPPKSQPRSQVDDFAFPTNPFSNPIFDYLERNKGVDNQKIIRTKPTNSKIVATQEDVIPGQFIKRKVTHQQVFVAPNVQSAYFNQNYAPTPFMNIPGGYQKLPNERVPENQFKKEVNTTQLENQTVDNVKNIVNAQRFPVPSYHPFLGYYNPVELNPYYSQLNAPYYRQTSRQQLTWPWQQYFPIVIKDPLVQMWSAFTSMVEYGPNSDVCSPGGKEGQEERTSRLGKALNYNFDKTKDEITIFNNETPDPVDLPEELEIEDLKIVEENPVKFTINFKTPAYQYPNRNNKAVKEESKKISIKNQREQVSPPVRDQVLDADELESEAEDVVLDTTISKQDGILHNNNKKVFSKDNTGSGIFIHKIRVKAGGVAIAGPGGIATAGSGGTAIVGPNGVAYTHPDSLAIAGSGSKVISVDPSIDLEDVINNNRNKTRRDGSIPREGKLVAVGPVVYYNKG